MNASHHARRSLACLAFILTACAAIERPPATVDSLTADGVTHDKAQRALFDAAIDRLALRAIARGDRTLDILLLSGGGQHDLEVLAQAGLAHEFRQSARPQARLLRGFDGIRGRAQQLVSHRRVPSDRSASRSSSSTVPSSPSWASVSRTSSDE